MCLEHKQYWQCCLEIDSKYIDPCPYAQTGYRCKIEERVHPIGGYCVECRRALNKLEDDIVTTPMCSKNDGYDRPWDTTSSNVAKSKSQLHSSRYDAAYPGRGRRPTRTNPSMSTALVHVPKNNHDYREPAPSPPPLKRYNEDWRRKHHSRSSSSTSNTLNEYRQPRPRYGSPSSSLRPEDRRGRQYKPSTRYETIWNEDHHSFGDKHYATKPYGTRDLHRHGCDSVKEHSQPHLRPKRNEKHDHRRHSRSPSAHPIHWRVASPRTVERLQRKGIIPPTEELRALQLAANRR